jgi:hypothetical protein
MKELFMLIMFVKGIFFLLLFICLALSRLFQLKMMNVALAHVDLVHANERDVLVDGVFTQKKLDGVDVVLVLKRPTVVAVILSP